MSDRPTLPCLRACEEVTIHAYLEECCLARVSHHRQMPMNHRSRKAQKKSKQSRGKSSNKNSTKEAQNDDGASSRTTWVDALQFRPVVVATVLDSESSAPASATASASSSLSMSVISWNVLAQAYCSRRSQVRLPMQYQKRVFVGNHRRDNVIRALERFAAASGSVRADVLCLQEVDMDEIRVALGGCGYRCVETPRTSAGAGGTGGRVDSCSIFVREETWKLVDHDLVRLDELATLESTSTASPPSDGETAPPATTPTSTPASNNLQGLQQSFLRRNVALLVRIQHVSTGETAVVANCHLYWNPGYEYVKLCQAHYVLVRARAFCRPGEKFVLCGDLNSKPGGAVHTYLSQGSVHAKQYAPWYRFYDRELEDREDEAQRVGKVGDSDEAVGEDDNGSSRRDDSGLADRLSAMGLTSDPPPMGSPRYLLDATLNKLCRWLRILGRDAALETDEEEKLRTGKGKMIIFERCRDEKRTLVTTSTRLQCRSDCPPGTYVISPTFLDKLEVVLVHMLLTHGVVLEPDSFLSRCVICNGGIEPVHAADDKRRILKEYDAPVDLLKEDLEVFQCEGCRQGYWWCDRPTSSASRVKGTATRLFQLCLQAGVPIHGSLTVMDGVDAEEERKRGWDYSQPGSELLNQKLVVVDWLRSDTLECPFRLESAYARKSDDGRVAGEALPFTNVTHDFIDTLDYIFQSGLEVSERLQIPTNLSDLNVRSLENGHLIPSDIWPSDHLPVGARLVHDSHPLESEPQTVDFTEFSCSLLGSGPPPPVRPHVPVAAAVHSARCNCGCVPNVPSLFEMAELRRKARLARP